MKSALSALAAVLLAVPSARAHVVAVPAAAPSAAPQAAQPADMSAVGAALAQALMSADSKSFPVPAKARTATPASKPAVAPANAACTFINLTGATIGRGLFSENWKIREGDKEIGSVSPNDGGYAVTVAGSRVSIFVARSADGAVAAVTDCDGSVVGTVEEADAGGAGNFTVKDPASKVIAAGMSSGTTFEVRGSGGWALIANDHWLLDRYKITVDRLDSRLIAALTLLNDEALYREAARRRRENPPEHGHGRGR